MPSRANRSGTRIRERLAAYLRRERAKREWTQTLAAETAGIDPRHWRKLEAAEVNFTVKTLERICKAFAVDVRELFADEADGGERVA